VLLLKGAPHIRAAFGGLLVCTKGLHSEKKSILCSGPCSTGRDGPSLPPRSCGDNSYEIVPAGGDTYRIRVLASDIPLKHTTIPASSAFCG
jgi:hypothetical protein